MKQKTITTIGWILSIAVGLLFAMSAFMKLTLNETAVQQATAAGFDPETYRLIGVIEIGSLILFLFPRTGIIGALLLIAYMGGAIATHLQHQQPIHIAVAVQVVLWIASALRFPQLASSVLPSFKKIAIRKKTAYPAS